MMNVPDELSPRDKTQIFFAYPSDDYVVFRVVGRGTFQNSIPLKRSVSKMRDRKPDLRFIIDLDQCVSMDSTFMGVLASIGLTQQRSGLPDLVCVNANEHTRKLLKTLGLSHFLDVRPGLAADAEIPGDREFKEADSGEANKRQRIVHMIEAHEELINLDSENAVRFENVMRYLNESLEREGEAGDEPQD